MSEPDRSFSMRDSNWRSYRVLLPLPGLLAGLAVGATFRAYPWGDVIWQTETLGPVNIPELLQSKAIEQC